MNRFGECVEKHGETLVKGSIHCLQMNLGYACNLACKHCHLEAGPHRSEKMNRAVIDDCIRFTERMSIKVVDITGGAPELNPHFRYLIKRLRSLDSVNSILLRSNLAILDDPEYADLPEFLSIHNVDVIASLPCYLEENVNAQRGNGVYDKNIRILKKLNHLGFGTSGPKLHLVYNPGGDFLPGPQPALEAAYKENLGQQHEISFNNLYTITNMPIGRFRKELKQKGLLGTYVKLLEDNFNSANLEKVMCRNQINVDWQGKVYDCDFNHVLQLPIDVADTYIGNVSASDLTGTSIQLGQHCFACVAGSGSSCQGSLDQLEI